MLPVMNLHVSPSPSKQAINKIDKKATDKTIFIVDYYRLLLGTKFRFCGKWFQKGNEEIGLIRTNENTYRRYPDYKFTGNEKVAVWGGLMSKIKHLRPNQNDRIAQMFDVDKRDTI